MLRGRGVDFVTFSESVMVHVGMSCTERSRATESFTQLGIHSTSLQLTSVTHRWTLAVIRSASAFNTENKL